MHLTEASRAMDEKTSGSKTNQDHPSVELTLQMMAVALSLRTDIRKFSTIVSFT